MAVHSRQLHLLSGLRSPQILLNQDKNMKRNGGNQKHIQPSTKGQQYYGLIDYLKFSLEAQSSK